MAEWRYSDGRAVITEGTTLHVVPCDEAAGRLIVDTVAALTAQRDELAAALRQAYRLMEEYHWDRLGANLDKYGALVAARAALAKAEEGG